METKIEIKISTGLHGQIPAMPVVQPHEMATSQDLQRGQSWPWSLSDSFSQRFLAAALITPQSSPGPLGYESSLLMSPSPTSTVPLTLEFL